MVSQIQRLKSKIPRTKSLTEWEKEVVAAVVEYGSYSLAAAALSTKTEKVKPSALRNVCYRMKKRGRLAKDYWDYLNTIQKKLPRGKRYFVD